MGHDDGADHAGGGAPAGLEGVLQGVVPAGEGHVIGAGELVPEIVAGAALQRLAVLHHGLDGVGGLGAGKLFLVGLAALNDGDVQFLLKEIRVAVQLLGGLGLGLLGGLVDGVALLPPEFPAAQEGTGGLFPPHHAAPLVVFHGQLTIAVQHPAPVVAEHGLAGGTDGHALLQRLAAAGGDPRHLGGKAVDQFALLFQQALGDEQRHGHVLVAGGLEPVVHQPLDVLPDGLPVGTQNDKALDAGVFHQLGLGADVGVPLRKIHFLRGDGLHHFFLVVCHDSPLPPLTAAPPRRRPHRPPCGRSQYPHREFPRRIHRTAW